MPIDGEVRVAYRWRARGSGQIQAALSGYPRPPLDKFTSKGRTLQQGAILTLK